ncbi:SH3-binding, glutamic acid-rich protein-domain-containing protein [Suillus americanus]|nr:SH3-binding, glutamic acid-rich protein-domain-containing protein [Suillus americanus]
MPSPPIQIFLTTIASQVVIRKRQEYILRILQTKKIPYTSYDLASDDDAKRLWRRKAPPDKQQLPGILVGGRFIGDFDAFEEAVETEGLATFLRLNESWDIAIDEDRPAPEVKPVGVPGAVPIAQMTPEHHKPRFFPRDPDTPLKPVNKREEDFDVSTELEGYGLQGVRVTDDDLRLLVEELGLEGDDAEDMVKSLGGNGKGAPQKGGEGDEKAKAKAKEATKDTKSASVTKEDNK